MQVQAATPRSPCFVRVLVFLQYRHCTSYKGMKLFVVASVAERHRSTEKPLISRFSSDFVGRGIRKLVVKYTNRREALYDRLPWLL